MSRLKVNTIKDAAGTGTVDLEDDIKVDGVVVSSANTYDYYDQASEPSTPNNGAIWWNDPTLKIYVNNAWKTLTYTTLGGPWTFDVDDIGSSTSQVSHLSHWGGIVRGTVFSPDGLKHYYSTSAGAVQFADLTTGFDLSTFDGSQSYNYFNYPSQAGMVDVALNDDGTKIYMLQSSSFDGIRTANMSTAYDLSTASADSSENLDVSSQTTSPNWMHWHPDGDTVFVGGGTTVYKYSLTTAWDVSTGSYANSNVNLTQSGVSSWIGGFFDDAGTKIYLLDFSSKKLYQANLTTPWDLSTASMTSLTAADLSFGIYNIYSADPRTDDGSEIFVQNSNRQWVVFPTNN